MCQTRRWKRRGSERGAARRQWAPRLWEQARAAPRRFVGLVVPVALALLLAERGMQSWKIRKAKVHRPAREACRLRWSRVEHLAMLAIASHPRMESSDHGRIVSSRRPLLLSILYCGSRHISAAWQLARARGHALQGRFVSLQSSSVSVGRNVATGPELAGTEAAQPRQRDTRSLLVWELLLYMSRRCDRQREDSHAPRDRGLDGICGAA